VRLSRCCICHSALIEPTDLGGRGRKRAGQLTLPRSRFRFLLTYCTKISVPGVEVGPPPAIVNTE
jgi:hypothetical protein